MNNYILFILIFLGGVVFGIGFGFLISNIIISKKEKDFLNKMKILGEQNNDIYKSLRDVISFNNKLSEENRYLNETLKRFIKEFT